MSLHASTMRAYTASSPNLDIENPRFSITVEWTWPVGDYWSAFQIVRSIRSPALRVEEGLLMCGLDGAKENRWEDRSPETLNPILVDYSPPPGEWTYYSLFVLNVERVWTYVNSAVAIGIADYDWTLRLPELLPGASVSTGRGVADPAEQSHDLVQFLQSPGTYLDATVTMAESVQFFWDPRRVPPQALPALCQSWGYRYTDSIGPSRNREIMAALRSPAQGSMDAITSIATAAIGTQATSTISNNLMLDVGDSSFEVRSRLLSDTRWGPVEDTEVREYFQWTSPPGLLPANVLSGYFLYIGTPSGPRTLKCGAGDGTDPEHIKANAIPIQQWTHLRMGCYALDDVFVNAGSPATLSMGMDLYDKDGALLRSVTALEPVTLTASWAYYATPSAGTAPDGVPLPLPPPLDPDADPDTAAPDWAYGVPWLSVSDACSVDLVVVDDG